MRDIIQPKTPDLPLAYLRPSANHSAMHDPTWQRFMELIRNLDPDTREIVRDLVRRLVPLEEIILAIEKRRH